MCNGWTGREGRKGIINVWREEIKKKDESRKERRWREEEEKKEKGEKIIRQPYGGG